MARIWHRLMLYLPVAIMGVLALVSYWLVRTAPEARHDAATESPSSAPDYFLRRFTAQSFNPQGRVVRQVQGASGRHFAQNNWTEIDSFQAQAYGRGADVLFAQAQHSLSNEDASEFQLRGDAQVLRPALELPGQPARPRALYRGAFLHVFTQTEIAKSHLPVEIEYGKHRFSADAMVYDNVAQTLELKGRVKADFAPPPRKR